MRIPTITPGQPRADRRGACFPLVFAMLTMALLGAGAWAQGAPHSGLRHDAALDARNAEGLTPLIVAASAGETDTVKSLLAQGADQDATAADGRTPLIAATQGGQIEAVRALIAAHAKLNWAARRTGTALNVAENQGETQIAALLVAAGAHTSGKSVGDTVCVRPWGGDGFCGTVKSFSVRSVQIQVTRIVGCAKGCAARNECSAARAVGGADGVQAGDQIAVPSWCLTQTGVKP
jgi:hypothetical protein